MFSGRNMRRRERWLASRPSSTTHGYEPTPLIPVGRKIKKTYAKYICFEMLQGLVKSNVRADQHLGVMLLSEIFRTSPERRRECLYYLALGNYKLGNYAQARKYNDALLENEPANLQAANLRTLIDDKVTKEGLMGVAIISGVAVAAGVIGGVLLRNLGRKR